jgi:pilus assembly protein CpaE
VAITSEILILTDDSQLRDELQTAARSMGDEQPRMRFVGDRPALLEAIRSRPPMLVLMPFGDDPRDVAKVAKELSMMSPAVPVAAIFRPNGFRDNVSESSVLIDSLRAGVRDFLRRPVSTTELRTLIDNIAQNAEAVPASGGQTFGRVVSFISNKGGVGKSTMAVNTAVGLALRHPGRVLLIDASLQMGVAAALLDIRPEATLADVAAERDRLDATMIRQMAIQHPSGLHLLAAPSDAVLAMDVDDTLIARVITLARRTYDYVIIDTFPMFDRVVVAALDLSDRAFVVVENVVPTLLGAISLLNVLERIGFPAERQKLIVNRNQSIAGNLSLPDIAVRLQRTIDYVFPFDKRVIAAANLGQPEGLHSMRFSGFSRMLQTLVSDVESLSAGGVEISQASSGRTVSGTSRQGQTLVNPVLSGSDAWRSDLHSEDEPS